MYVLFSNIVNTISVMRSSPSNRKSMDCSVRCVDWGCTGVRMMGWGEFVANSSGVGTMSLSSH